MPGATPAEAVREFIAPLQAALGCVARGKISHTSGGGNPKPGQQHQWSLNDGGGARLRRRADFPMPGQLELHASMYWRVIKDEREGYGPYRVTTTGYDYSLVIGDDVELWAMHWHGQGRSHEIKPHLHLGDTILSDRAPVTSRSHLRTGRMTFETAIRWAITWGAVPLHDDWEDRLVLAETPHLLFRSWSTDPDIQRTGST
ncbi:MAG: hypothetical protein LC799_12265 [Actinobacteria bacterium]|nr:hypothetical protein [Actinomycetota bacterium]